MKTYISTLFFITLLTACGGGGSSDGASNAENTTSDFNTNGKWSGYFTIPALSCGGDISMTFTQTIIKEAADTITGNVNATQSSCGGLTNNTFSFTGTVSGNNIIFTDDENDTYNLQGNESTLTGTITSASLATTVNVNLTKQ